MTALEERLYADLTTWDGRPETKDREIPVLLPFLRDRILTLLESQLSHLQAQVSEKDKELESAREHNSNLKAEVESFRPMAERWNIERTAQGELLVCKNDHEKNEGCFFDKWVPEERLTAAEARIKELEAAVTASHVAMSLASALPGVAAEYDFSDALAATAAALRSREGGA